jgi:hypothetical protein
MGGIKDFMAPALRHSFSVLRDVAFRLEGELLVVSFRAFGGFRPLALEGLNIVLKTHTLDGWRDIRGCLKYDSALLRHGTWYPYRFVPERDHEVSFILETGLCRWTNIHTLVFDLPDGLRSKVNRLFKPIGEPPAADSR